MYHYLFLYQFLANQSIVLDRIVIDRNRHDSNLLSCMLPKVGGDLFSGMLKLEVTYLVVCYVKVVTYLVVL